MSTIDITILTNSQKGLIKKNKDLLDKLNLVVQQYQNILSDRGINNEFELFDEIVDELEKTKNIYETLIYRLYQIQGVGFENNYRIDISKEGLPNLNNNLV